MTGPSEVAYIKKPSRTLRNICIFSITEQGNNPDEKIHLHFQIMKRKPADGNLKSNTGKTREEVDRILSKKIIQSGESVMSDQHSMYLKLRAYEKEGFHNRAQSNKNRKEKYIITRKGNPILKVIPKVSRTSGDSSERYIAE